MSKHDVDQLIDDVGLPQASAERRVAGILFTYRCSIACRHCLFGCASDRPGVAMTPRQCADYLGLLHETGRVVHVAGGEPMLYWGALAEAVRLSAAEGNAPHFIETNCSFAADDTGVAERLSFLAEHGVKGIYASADPFHQEFVPAERFLRVRRLAREIFGERNFYGPANSDTEVLDFVAIVRDETRLREYVRGRKPRMVGTAHERLGRHLDPYGPSDPQLPGGGWGRAAVGRDCRAQFESGSMWEIHIDPYGNIQTNCGMVLGTLPATTPAALLASGPERANRFVATVCSDGAMGLAEWAQRAHGFAPPEKVTQTCELCYLTRRFLRPFHPEVFGPEEVYA